LNRLRLLRRSWHALCFFSSTFSSGDAFASNKRVTIVRIAVLSLAIVLVAGCASQPLRPGADNPARVTNSINLSGFPAEYKRGFTIGCETAADTSGRVAQRPKGDASLVQGWQDGFDYCGPRRPR